MNAPNAKNRRPFPPFALAIGLWMAVAELVRYVWRTNPRLLPIVIVAVVLAVIIGYTAVIAPLTPFLYPLF